MATTSTLRAVANRFTATPIDELPNQVGYLATTIASCKELLQSPSVNSDQQIIIHKLKTRVSALLQDRTSEGRFCGAVIARALAEAGGQTILSESGNWVRSLISCINKKDEPELRKIYVTSVSRIYLLTFEHPNLVREITTPTLPAFASATLSAIKPQTTTVDRKSVRALSPLLECVLRSWHVLIENFASTFRPNTTSIRSICLSLISDEACPQTVRSAANELFARLHWCVPKNSIAAEWSQACSQAIEAAHDTADLVLRAVVEDWETTIPRMSKSTRKQRAANIPTTTTADVLGLDLWSGITQGCSRLASQVDILRYLVTSQHATEVNIPLGVVADLTSRLSAVTMPTSKFAPMTNNEITRDEREELWLNLPRVHVAILRLFDSLAKAFGQALTPISRAVTTQLWDIFEAERAIESVRAAAYQLVSVLLPQRLLYVSKAESAPLKALIQSCCNDLMVQSGYVGSSSKSTTTDQANGKKSNGSIPLTMNPAIRPGSTMISPASPELYSAAFKLLPILTSYTPWPEITAASKVRAQIDSTSILLGHRKTILASVLSPLETKSKTQVPPPSLMPFLARVMEDGTASEVEKLGVEALLRPRVPIITSSADTSTEGAPVADGASDDEEASSATEGLDEEEEITNGHNNVEMREAMVMEVVPTHSTVPSKVDHSLFSSGASKRDFTTLLEKTTDEQIAASAAEQSTATLGHDSNVHEGSAKRQRLDTNVSDAVLPAEPWRSEADGAVRDQSVDAIEAPVVPLAAEISEQLDNDKAIFLDKGKEKAVSYDSDSSDESDIPLIDATLVGMTDSENEDE